MADSSHSGQGLPGGTVTFLLTDVEGSTALWEQAPATMRAALARHDELFEAAVRDHAGAHIRPRGEGDSRFAVFAGAVDAVAAALAIQRALATEPWPTPGPISVRIGIHTGEAQLREGDYYGAAVNRCARLRGIGHGGQILLSEATAVLVRDDLPTGTSVLDLGEHRLKDLTRPERVFQLTAPDLPADFPALASLDARPHNLPIQLTSLIGREREVRAVCDLLRREDVRLVTLTGPGGTGKTRVGLQVAAELLDEFADGTVFVELAPISDPELVVSTIAQTLGVREVGNRPILETLQEYLGEKRLLLVLDNFEQILPAAPAIGDLLGACPGLKVLVTSRAVLRLRGEHELPVPPLALPEPGSRTLAQGLATYQAIALFTQRATDIRPDFALTDENAIGVTEICRRLDGLPLAIELGAARVKLLTPQAMLARLERRLPLLTGGARDLPERQRTLRDTIAWSYDLLDEAEQRLFRRLAVFVGGCTLEAAEDVVQRSAFNVQRGGSQTLNVERGTLNDVLDGLASLVDKSLLRQVDGPNGEPRFVMLETIREYGLEQLEASGEAAEVRRQHLAWFTDLAARGQVGIHSLDGAAWLDRLAADLDNFRAALAWSLADPDRSSLQAGLVLAGALFQFWHIRAYLAEGQRWFEQTLAADRERGRAGAAADASGDRLEPSLSVARTGAFGAHPRVVALNELALLYRHVGDVQRATQPAEQALALAREVGDRVGEGHALVELGVIADATGEYERAIPLLEAGLALFRSLDDRLGIWRGTNVLGQTLIGLGDDERPRELFEESLAVVRSMGHQWSVAAQLRSLGIVAYRQGDLDRAMELLEESLAVWATLRATRGPHDALCELGHVLVARSDPQRAAARYAASLELCKEMGDRLGIARCLEGLAGVVAATSDGGAETGLIRAVRLLGAAAALRQALGVPVSRVDRPTFERAVAAVRAGVGEDAFAAAWAEGRALPLDEAIEVALEVARQTQAPASGAVPGPTQGS